MRIEKLELIGFKSFAERTVFNFHPGITCIVGPNGCGKSNIVDAFRWVLGEQSAKSLRGEKMEEVIFNGSATKKQKGMAEVTMYISGLNSLGKEGDDNNGDKVSDTISITRRLYRSGESEYLINKTQCRLKDIKDLFLDTGLEVKSYSILEQERIIELLNAKPVDRRIIIEEIAGVMKYNVRRKEALSKIESSRMNLQRINDIIAEVKKQLSYLERIAKKAERYKKLLSEMNSIELKIYKRDYESLKSSLEILTGEYNRLKEEETVKKGELSAIENQVSKMKIEMLEEEKHLEGIQSEYQSLEKEIADIEKEIAIAKTEKDNLNEYLEKLFQQNEEYNKKKVNALLGREELEKECEELLNEIAILKSQLSEKSESYKGIEDEILRKERLIEEKRKRLFIVSEEISNIRNDKNKFQSSLESLKAKERASIEDLERLKSIISEIDSSLKDITVTIVEKNNELIMLNDKKNAVSGDITNNKEHLEDIKGKLFRYKEEIASLISRYDSLKEIVFDESTKQVLSNVKDFNIIASISDIFEIDERYEKAVESVLSDKIISYILPAFSEIERAIITLKEKSISRTAFIPLRPYKFNKKTTPPDIIGRMSDFINTKEEFLDVIDSIFGNIFIVKDIRTAQFLLDQGFREYYVTLDGEVIEPTGVIIAGEVKGILKRKREIRELERLIHEQKSKIEKLQNEVYEVSQLIQKKEIEFNSISDLLREREKEISILKMNADNLKDEYERRSKKLAYIKLEIEQINKEKEELMRLIYDKEIEIQSMELKKSEIENSIVLLQEELNTQKSLVDEHRVDITDIKLSLASFNEKMDSMKKEIEGLEKEISEIEIKKGFISEEIESVKQRLSQREEEIINKEEKIKELVIRVKDYQSRINEKKDIIGLKNENLLEAEDRLKILRQEIESLTKTLSDLDVKKAENRIRLQTVYDNVMQNYGVSIDNLQTEIVTEEDGKRLAEIREKIKDIGPVSVYTIDEYEELKKRYEFLKNQQDDLIKSISELEEAISRINTTTKRRLREAYEALRLKFSEVFKTLFGGGKAELILTEENNILEAGIDIVAQPPGKKLQNISLLSGGEKALTALSLLFASFLLKPTPLCILDEADSALDEINIEKFANTIRELSKDTQFIVVTHNKNTMSVADYIYGITMEEAGVSKVISMQLVESTMQ